jgi:electron transport complex protein RnfE
MSSSAPQQFAVSSLDAPGRRAIIAPPTGTAETREREMRRGTFAGEFAKGIWAENPVFVLLLGLCPTLAVTTRLKNGVGMAAAATFVLICCNLIISLIRKLVPDEIRIPCYIAVIAAFVTIVDNAMHGYLPELHKALGIFVPLIVVNCIILGRAEAFASKNSPLLSVADALGIGLGYLVTLSIISGIREVTGSGKLWDIQIWNLKSAEHIFQPVAVMISPVGAFLLIGLLLGFFRWRNLTKQKKNKLQLAAEIISAKEAAFAELQEKRARAKEKETKKKEDTGEQQS